MNHTLLRASVRGQVIARGDAGYQLRRRSLVWNQLQPPHRPAFIAAPADAADVVACVRFARAQGLRVAVRGGGHNWCAAALQPDSLLLDLSDWRDVAVDSGARRATAQPGVRNGDFCRALSAHGLAFPYGHCSSVALGGYLLAGGFGWNTGAWGPACLSVRGAELVTADGQLIAADATQNPDLFWALRGAGAGFFAVVTRYDLALQPLPRAIAGSTFVYPLELLPVVAASLSALAGALSQRVEVTLFAASAPPDLASEGRGMVCVVEAQAFADSPDEAAALLAPLEGGPALSACLARRVRQPRIFADLFAAMDRRFPAGHRYLADTFLTDAPPDAVLGAVAELMSRAPSQRSLLLCVLTPPPAADTPPAAPMALSITGRVFVICYAVWDSPDADERNLAWHREVVERLEPFATSHYIGEADLRRPARARRSFAAANWERLLALRAAHDPQRLFHSVLDEEAEAHD